MILNLAFLQMIKLHLHNQLSLQEFFVFAVNQRVAGSSPVAGAKNQQDAEAAIQPFAFCKQFANT
jgi:hypothetical protein